MSHSPNAPLSSGSRKKLQKVLPISVLPPRAVPAWLTVANPSDLLETGEGPSTLSCGQALPCPVRDQPQAPGQGEGD